MNQFDPPRREIEFSRIYCVECGTVILSPVANDFCSEDCRRNHNGD